MGLNELVSGLALFILLTVGVVIGIGVYQQLGPCTEACEELGMACRGTTVPPWGEDMKCACLPRKMVSLSKAVHP